MRGRLAAPSRGPNGSTAEREDWESAMRMIAVMVGVSWLARPAAAQVGGTLEVGAFGRFTKYDPSFATARPGNNNYGAGARLGYYLSPRVSIELDASFNATDLKDYFT